MSTGTFKCLHRLLYYSLLLITQKISLFFYARSLSCPDLKLPVPCADGTCHSDYISCLRVCISNRNYELQRTSIVAGHMLKHFRYLTTAFFFSCFVITVHHEPSGGAAGPAAVSFRGRRPSFVLAGGRPQHCSGGQQPHCSNEICRGSIQRPHRHVQELRRLLQGCVIMTNIW